MDQPTTSSTLRPQLTKSAASAFHTGPTVRPMGRVNGRGLWTLYVKEVRRFLNVFTQTLIAPVVTTLLFLAIFTLALGGNDRQLGNVPFANFLAPGLIMMAMAQNAFANTSSTLVIAKIQGNIVDLLMPPLNALEVTLGMVGGGITRGLLVGCCVFLGMWIFVPLGIHAPFFVLFHGVMAVMMLSLLGMIGGIWAEKFDHIAAVTNFVITPFSFLSGTFYSIDRLPDSWRLVSQFNPFFYMIDGFRYGFIGYADGSLWVGIAVMLSVNLALMWLTYQMLAKGYRLKP